MALWHWQKKLLYLVVDIEIHTTGSSNSLDDFLPMQLELISLKVPYQGIKRESGAESDSNPGAAPATVIGECFANPSHWMRPGRQVKRTDPRARRPAATSFQSTMGRGVPDERSVRVAEICS